MPKINKQKNINKTDQGFFDLTQKEQKRILDKAAQEANKEQLDLVKRYDKQFGGLKTSKT